MLTTYLAGAIEAVSAEVMKGWRDEIFDKLASPKLLVYDPVKQEAFKVGKPSGDQVKYIKGLKQGGHWTQFFTEMWKIWFGKVQQNSDIIEVLKHLRMKKYTEGNKIDDMVNWGDAEAVVRSDFIVVYWPKDVKTIGTVYEIVLAFMFRIPIFLILPDAPKIDTNSSLIFGVMISGGDVFYNVGDCVKHIKDKYNLDKTEE